MASEAGNIGAVAYERPLPSLTPFATVWNKIRWPLATVAEFALIIAFWEVVVVQLKWVGAAYLSPPSAIAFRIDEMIRIGYLQENITFSVQNFVMGYIFAAGIGLPFGLMMGSIRAMDRLLSPFVWAFYSTPRITLQPIIVIWLGFGWESKVLIIFLTAVFPILVNAMAGVQTVDQSLLRAGRVFGASRLHMYTKIILPSTLPFVLTGLRLGISRGLVGMIVGEMFGSSLGLGHIVARAATVFDTTTALSGTIVVVVLANIAMALFLYLERRLVPWQKDLAGK